MKSVFCDKHGAYLDMGCPGCKEEATDPTNPPEEFKESMLYIGLIVLGLFALFGVLGSMA